MRGAPSEASSRVTETMLASRPSSPATALRTRCHSTGSYSAGSYAGSGRTWRRGHAGRGVEECHGSTVAGVEEPAEEGAIGELGLHLAWGEAGQAPHAVEAQPVQALEGVLGHAGLAQPARRGGGSRERRPRLPRARYALLPGGACRAASSAVERSEAVPAWPCRRTARWRACCSSGRWAMALRSARGWRSGRGGRISSQGVRRLRSPSMASRARWVRGAWKARRAGSQGRAWARALSVLHPCCSPCLRSPSDMAITLPPACTSISHVASAASRSRKARTGRSGNTRVEKRACTVLLPAAVAEWAGLVGPPRRWPSEHMFIVVYLITRVNVDKLWILAAGFHPAARGPRLLALVLPPGTHQGRRKSALAACVSLGGAWACPVRPMTDANVAPVGNIGRGNLPVPHFASRPTPGVG